jgi:membrane protein
MSAARFTRRPAHLARSFSRRFSDYLSVLLIGPVLIVASTGLSGAAMNNEIIGYIAHFEPLGMLIRVAVVLVPLAMAIGAFTMIYIFIPNTKVQVPAAWSAAVSPPSCGRSPDGSSPSSW